MEEVSVLYMMLLILLHDVLNVIQRIVGTVTLAGYSIVLGTRVALGNDSLLCSVSVRYW